jgi:ketosteroid isomerase-like protein
MSQENVELARKAIYSVVDAPDLVAAFRDEEFLRELGSALEPLTDPEFTFVLAEPEFTGLGGVYEGHQGFVHAQQEWLSAWETYSNQPEEFIEVGEQVLVLAREGGRTKTGGVEVEILSATVWNFRLGKVLRVEAYQDRAKALKAVGLSEQTLNADP